MYLKVPLHLLTYGRVMWQGTCTIYMMSSPKKTLVLLEVAFQNYVKQVLITANRNRLYSQCSNQNINGHIMMF